MQFGTGKPRTSKSVFLRKKDENDGSSLPENDANRSGMGMQIMNYRARMIGGSLKVETGGVAGVTVTCLFPLPEVNVSLEKARP